jgi:hypothetical protein
MNHAQDLLAAPKPYSKGPLARLITFALLLVLLVGSPRTVFGQAQNTGTLSGNVTDIVGALVPHATVVLTSKTTGQVTKRTTNARGEYLFSDVRVGQYRLVVSASSFTTTVLDNVVVDADQNVRLDAKLNAGGASETVTVEAGGVTLDTRSATVGTLIDQKLIDDLPIDSNNIVALAGLLPGVVNVNSPTTFTNGALHITLVDRAQTRI